MSSNNNHNAATTSSKVRASRFYGEYYGHKVKDLKILYPPLRDSCDSLIWTAGDSSLDNKYWFSDHRHAVGVYRDILDPPTSNADVTYWMNYLLEEQQQQQQTQNAAASSSSSSIRLAAINTAVEATTLNERTRSLRPQDRFIRDHIQSNDILVVSVGGNDVALVPTPCTIVSILSLVCCMPSWCLENGCVAAKVPFDDYCCGCSSSLLNCTCALPPCLGYMSHLFGVRVQKYIEALTSKTKPRKILICMIYYPDENHVPSWAGPALGALGYNSNPEKLQLLIRRAFVEATSKIQIPGSETIPVPLFHALDGKDSRDYIARVEPSSIGGRKMAEFILNIIHTPSGGTGGNTTLYHSSTVPAPVGRPLMADR